MTDSKRTRMPCKIVGCVNMSRAISGLCVTHRQLPVEQVAGSVRDTGYRHNAAHTGAWLLSVQGAHVNACRLCAGACDRPLQRVCDACVFDACKLPVQVVPDVDPEAWTAGEWAFAIAAAVLTCTALVAAIMQHRGL